MTLQRTREHTKERKSHYWNYRPSLFCDWFLHVSRPHPYFAFRLTRRNESELNGYAAPFRCPQVGFASPLHQIAKSSRLTRLFQVSTLPLVTSSLYLGLRQRSSTASHRCRWYSASGEISSRKR